MLAIHISKEGAAVVVAAAALPTGRGFLQQLAVISRPGQLALSAAALMGPEGPAHTDLPRNKSTRPLAIPTNHRHTTKLNTHSGRRAASGRSQNSRLPKTKAKQALAFAAHLSCLTLVLSRLYTVLSAQ